LSAFVLFVVSALNRFIILLSSASLALFSSANATCAEPVFSVDQILVICSSNLLSFVSLANCSAFIRLVKFVPCSVIAVFNSVTFVFNSTLVAFKFSNEAISVSLEFICSCKFCICCV
jgi:hypothetical protein